MKNLFIKIFAIIGILLFSLKVFTFFEKELIARKYFENCKKVKVGMSLSQAREIVGDIDYQYWTKSYKSGSIIVNPEAEEKRKFSLEYQEVFAGSDHPQLYFDPKTLKITEVFTGE